MNSIEIFFERPWLLLLLLPALLVILLPFFLLPAKRRRSAKKIIPVILHTVIVLLLCLILSGFTILKSDDRQTVLLLLDLSFSTEPVEEQISQRAEELLSLIDKKTPVGVVVFGADQLYELKLEQKSRTLTLEKPKGEATDLEGALDYLLTVLPEGRPSRVVLLSDGKQNAGSAESAAYRLAEKGIRVDAYYFDSTSKGHPELQISSFTSPDGVWAKGSSTLSCEITGNVETTATLSLYANGKLLSEQSVATKKGSVPVVFPLEELSAGIHTYSLTLTAPKGTDTIAQNNTALTALSVCGKQKLLVLDDYSDGGAALAALLGEEFDVTVKRAHNAPKTITELCNYDSIVMLNVEYYSLPAGFNNQIAEYVGAYGRNLFLVGGEETFMFGNMEDTVFEKLSPVSFKLEESPEGTTVALMLVLDCSSSMKGEFLALAKQGAIKSLEALYSNDQAGIVCFDKDAVLKSPLIAADTNGKEALTRVISALQVGSGTYYTRAIEIAAEELAKSDADVKHILFLSDGRPSDGGYYDAVINANDQDITISTIGLDYASSVLDNMAYYGKGRYHYVESAEDLPEIMLSEAEQSRINPTFKGPVFAEIKRQSPFTEGLDATALPPLEGYLGTTPKEDAEVHLVTDRGHPLFSTLTCGFGTVSLFASDLGSEWSESWFANDTASALIRKMLTFPRPAVHSDTSLSVSVTRHGTGIRLTVNTTGKSASNTVSALLKDPEGKEITLDLRPLQKGLYEGFLQTKEQTLYELTVVEKTPNGEEVDSATVPLAVGWCPEYDAFAKDGKALLSVICNLTGGKLLETAAEGARISLPAAKTPKSPHLLFLVLCGILFLIDVAVRRLRIKDLKEHFYEWKELFRGKKRK